MSKLRENFNKLEQSKAHFYEIVESVAADKRTAQPGPGKWSLTQVAMHLVLAEGNSAKYIRKKLMDSSKSQKAGLGAWYRSTLLKVALKSPIKFKVPVKAIDPDNDTEWEDAKAQWDAVRADFAKIIDAFPEGDLQKEIFKHPLAGKMNLEQAFAFMDVHVNRHIGQLKNIKSQL